MKINKIKSFCKRANTVYLYETEQGRQWLSDGAGFWPVDESMHLNMDAIKALFEIAGKAWNESWVHEYIPLFKKPGFEPLNGKLPFHLLDEVWEPSAEVQMEPVDGSVIYNGKVFRAFEADDGLRIYVPEEHLKTINEDAVYYMMRQAEGARLLAVYDSMLICGLVAIMSAERAKRINEAAAKVIGGRYE